MAVGLFFGSFMRHLEIKSRNVGEYNDGLEGVGGGRKGILNIA
jgi:hypothetical protein